MLKLNFLCFLVIFGQKVAKCKLQAVIFLSLFRGFFELKLLVNFSKI